MSIEKILLALASHLRAMQLYYHSEHHLAFGVGFFADHVAFGEFYAAVEEDYDRVVEWSIGSGYPAVADPEGQMSGIHAVLGLDNAVEMETQLRSLCSMADEHDDSTLGFCQLVGDIAKASEVRSYKLGRRGDK